MEIVFSLGVALLLVYSLNSAYRRYKNKRRDQKSNEEPIVVPEVPNNPTPELPPVGNWAYEDDMVTSLEAGFHGDPNGPQDLMCVLALAMHYNNLPDSICTSPTRRGVDHRVTKTVVGLSGLGIPVRTGARTTHMERSEVSDYYVRKSKEGPFTIVAGGPATNIAQAIKQGANKRNLTVIMTLFGTSNEAGDQHAADYLKSSGVRVINIGSPEYQRLLWDMPRPGNIDERKFIDEFRDIPAWDRTFSAPIMRESSHLNLFQFKHDLPFRISDCMNVDRYLSGSPDTYKGYLNYNTLMKRIERGLNLLRQVPPGTPPEITEPDVEDRPPITNADFDARKVNTSGFPNALTWPIVSTIRQVKVSTHSVVIDHTHKNIWESRTHPSGAIVNANLWLVFKEKGTWVAYPFENLRTGQTRKIVGYEDILKQSAGEHDPDLRPGDMIGVFVSTHARRGDLANGQERSAIRWVTL